MARFRRDPSTEDDFFWRLARLEPGEKRVAYAQLNLDLKVLKKRGTAYVTDRRFIFVAPGLRKYGFRLKRDLASLTGWHLNTVDKRRGRTRLVIRTSLDGETVDLVFVPRAPLTAPADEFYEAFAQVFARVRQT